MSTAIGDLVASLGMNISPAQTAIGNAQEMFQRFSERTAGIMAKVKGSMGSLTTGLGMGVGIGAVLAGAEGVKSFFMDSIGLAQDSAKEQKKLGILLTATGASADLSAGQVGKFAEEMAKTTNYSKEATIAAASTMAVFKQRMSGDTFTAALKAAQDINSIMGGDLSETAQKVGMALSDPSRAMHMLRTEGVLFTEVQKKQIEQALAANDLTKAQGIILGQITATFGGDAQKMVSPMAQLKNQFLEIGEKIGSLLLPGIRSIAGGILGGVNAVVKFAESFGTNFGDVVATAQEAWASLTGFMSEVWQGAMLYVFGRTTTFGQLWSQTTAFVGDLIHGLGFLFRNFGDLAKLAIIDLVLKAIEWFPQMEGPIQAVAAGFIGIWAGVKAFFGAIIDNMIGGLKELMNFGKAVGAGIAAAWNAITSGNFKGAAGAMADAFVNELAHQQDVKAPNAFKEFGRAGDEAVRDFNDRINKSGGMNNALKGQQKELLDQIAKNETNLCRAASAQAARSAQRNAAQRV